MTCIQDCKRKDFHTQLPIQAIQSKLLLTIFAIFSGRIADVVVSIENLGFWEMVSSISSVCYFRFCSCFMKEFRLRKAELVGQAMDRNRLSWAAWSSRETTKRYATLIQLGLFSVITDLPRVLCGIFILSNMLTIAYDIAPFLSVTQDLDICIPEPDQNWQATSAQQWEELSSPYRNTDLPTVRDVLIYLVFNKPASAYTPAYTAIFNDRTIWSGFATTVVIHAVNIHMWHIMQCTQSLAVFSAENDLIRQSAILQTEKALARCQDFLSIHQPVKDLTSDSSEGLHIFNCKALLRAAYVRLFTGEGSFDRMLLLNENEDQITAKIRAYVRTPQRRDPFLTKSIAKAYEALSTPVNAGYLLVKRTAAFSWSIQHPLAGWDCGKY